MCTRLMKIIFTYFIISFSFINYLESKDLTKQEAIEKVIFQEEIRGNPRSMTVAVIAWEEIENLRH